MAVTPYTIVGKIFAPEPSTLENTKVYLKNMYGEQIEVKYDLDWDNTGLFTVNAGNFNHSPIIEEYMSIFAIDEIANFRKTFNFKITMSSPQFIPEIETELFDIVPPLIKNIYFLEGEYTNKRNNHLIMEVEGVNSIELYGDVVSPNPRERMLFNDQLVIKISEFGGVKILGIKFYDENNNMSEGEVSIIYDTIKPFVSNVNVPTAYNVVITFNEPVKQQDALTKSNYAISGVEVVDATIVNDYTVELTITRMFTIRYTVEIKNVRDLAGNAIDDTIVSFEGFEHRGFDWTDSEIDPDVTRIRFIHIDELRANAVIRGVSLPDGGWTDEDLAVDDDICFEHWNEIRDQVSRYYVNKYGMAIRWTTGPLVKGKSYLSARHIRELRAVIDAL